MLDQITPLILTYDEEPNIGRCLEQLRWAKRIVVVDSHSTDGTAAICRSFVNVEFVQRAFDSHTGQWNFGLELIRTPWVLTLDADYIVTREFNTEIACWIPTDRVAAYFARFKYRIGGKRLRASLYPPRAVLFRPAECTYRADGHTQRLRIDGATAFLNAAIDHDDRKPFSRWLWAQKRYAALEADKLLAAPMATLPWQDRARRLVVIAPPLVLGYTLFVKGLFFEGWPGWYYALQRALAESVLSVRLVKAALARRP